MKSLRVLVVDDSPAVRRILGRLVERVSAGAAEVREADNGVEALSMLQSSRADLVFCDIGMPAMGGLEFVERLRADKTLHDIPVVMISAGGQESNVIQALSAGARGYLRKPFTPEQIKEYLYSPLTMQV